MFSKQVYNSRMKSRLLIAASKMGWLDFYCVFTNVICNYVCKNAVEIQSAHFGGNSRNVSATHFESLLYSSSVEVIKSTMYQNTLTYGLLLKDSIGSTQSSLLCKCSSPRGPARAKKNVTAKLVVKRQSCGCKENQLVCTKQRLHPQSVAKISRHSVLSGDRIRQCGTSSGSRHKDTDQCL